MTSSWLRNHIRCCPNDSGTTSGRAAGASGHPPGDASRPGQLGDAGGGGGEQPPDRDFRVQHGADPGDQPHGQQRIPTQVEETVLGADPLQAQHLGEQAADDLLRRGPRLPAHHHATELRRGQRGPVQLPVDRHRQRIQDDQGRGDHVLRQPGRHVLAQLLRVHRTGAGRDDVADEALRPGLVLPRDHRRLRHRRVRGEHGLDLAGLDPEPAHLDLLIGAAGEHQLAVCGPAGQVPGPVHPRAGWAERAGHEPLGRQPSPPEIAAREPIPGDIQLTRHARRNRRQRSVEHIGLGVGHRPPSRHHGGAGVQGLAHGGADRHLGRPIRVDHPVVPRPSRGQPRRARLPRHHHGGHRSWQAIFDGGQHRRRHGQVSHPTRRHHISQRPSRRQHQRATRTQRHRQLRHRRIETQRRELQHPRPRTRPRTGPPGWPPARPARDATPRRPWAHPSTPTCRSHTPRHPRLARTPGPPVAHAAMAASVAGSSSTTAAAPPATPAVSAVHTIRAGRASASMKPIRSAGYSGSTGRYAAPVLATPSTAATISADRGTAIATTCSGPAPSPAR